MIPGIFRCKDCNERHPGCHGHCEKYIEDKAAHEKRKAALSVENSLNAYVRYGSAKQMDAKAKQRKNRLGIRKMTGGR